MTPPCSILIPSRNRPAFLRDSLSRLRAIGLADLPLLVYDDASDDPKAVADAVLGTWPGATLIRGDTKHGQCLGRNTLLRRCTTPFAIMLDDDQYIIELGPLFEYTDPARHDPTCAAVAFQNRDKHDGRLDFPATVSPRRSPFYMGGSVLFHVPSILATGGYREFWGYGYEEPELATRLFARGLHVWFDPRILVEHNHVVTAESGRDHSEYHVLYTRNAMLLSSLNMPLWIGLPIGLLRSWRRARSTPGYAAAKARGILAGFARTLRHWRERAPMSSPQALAWLRFNRNWTDAAP